MSVLSRTGREIAKGSAGADRAPEIALYGVAAGSPLEKAFRAALTSSIVLRCVAAPHAETRGWRRAVRGTSLQWFDSSGPFPHHAISARPDEICLDLLGIAERSSPDRPLWRIVDSEGHCLLAPFTGLASCLRAPFIASLLLVEATTSDQTWDIRAEAHISSRLPYRDLLNQLGHTAARLLRSALRNRTVLRTLVIPPSACRVSGTANISAHLVRAAMAGVAERWRSRLLTESWAIGRISRPISSLLADQTLAPDSWVRSPDARSYIADPFPWPGRPGTVLCERYDETTGRGDIVALSLHGRGAGASEVLELGTDCHLSYPFTWSAQGRVFCLPEMGGARRSVLYELDPATGTAEEVAVIAENRSLADPTLFLHEGLHWIAYTDTELGLHDNLCLMYAQRPEGPWSSHPANPVKIDVRSSRPGGTPFLSGGALYRPAQDCSRTYGGTLVLNRVVVCTPRSYEEVPVAVLRPDPDGPYPDGLHTLSLDEGSVLIDGKRLVFDARSVIRKLASRLARAARKPPARQAS